jgi:septum site-determining protein MinC
MDGMRRRFPQTFSNLNIVINLSSLELSDDQSTDLLLALKDGLITMGHHVVGCTGVKSAVAVDCGIKPVKQKVEASSKSLMTGTKHKEFEKPVLETKLEPKATPAPVTPPANPLTPKTEFINGPVRGGQQHYAKDSNLVILGDVKHGAEVAADGCITVFGKLEGRAHAGVKSSTATILATHFVPELVSIGGTYLAHQDIEQDAMKKNVLVQLKEEENKLIVHLA